MTVKEIRDSGLLELYAMGSLSEEENIQVEGYLLQFPELEVDLQSIQESLYAYGKSKGFGPSPNFENSIVEYVKQHADQSKNSKKSNDHSGFNNGWVVSAILTLIAAGAVIFALNKNKDLTNLQQSLKATQMECDSIQTQQSIQLEKLKAISDKNNRTLFFTPTDGYSETQLLFHINTESKSNFIQIKQLPSINKDQAFQLWSLKDGVDPIPLTVFKGDQDLIIPVDFEEGTATYAITIEPADGSLTPTLSRLIGTVGV